MKKLHPLLELLLKFVLVAAAFFLWPLFYLFDLWRQRKRLFSFEGRIGRKVYWRTLSIYLLYGIVMGTCLGLAEPWLGGSLLLYWGLLTALVFVPILVSAVAAGVRRLHDSGKSGWWLVLFYGLPGALFGIPGNANASDDTAGLCYLLALPFLIWSIFTLGCQRGTIGANGYGGDGVAAG
jgi:uncharacterized membrane protein YhaH (DUF805 family)